MFVLDRRGRGACIAGAVACFAAAYSLLPVAARSAAGDSSWRPRAPQLPVPVRSLAAVEPTRDPFLNERDRVSSPVGFRALPAIPPGAVAPLPNNLAEGVIPLVPSLPNASPAAATHAIAVVTGGRPYALLETGGRTSIKGIGDDVAGVRITGIGSDAVVLADGTLLAVRAARADGPQTRTISAPVRPANPAPVPVRATEAP